MKILVTGSRGFVGTRIMAFLPEAIPTPSLRTADEETVKRLIDAAAPDVVIHTAAMSDIPTCEKNPKESYHANVEIPVWLAKSGVKCVMFSTDQVYSGCDSEGPARRRSCFFFHPTPCCHLCPGSGNAYHESGSAAGRGVQLWQRKRSHHAGNSGMPKEKTIPANSSP